MISPKEKYTSTSIPKLSNLASETQASTYEAFHKNKLKMELDFKNCISSNDLLKWPDKECLWKREVIVKFKVVVTLVRLKLYIIS